MKRTLTGKQEPTGDRSLSDTCPKVMFSACHTSNRNDSEQEETRHSYSKLKKRSLWLKYVNLFWTITNSMND